MECAHVDTHCHLTDDRFDDDLPEVLERSRVAGVAAVTVGTDAATSVRAVELSRRHPALLRAAVGVHPNETGGVTEDDWREICNLARLPEVVAIGETGLDYHWHDVTPDVQKEWFRRHIELAQEVKKPLSVHARESAADVMRELSPYLEEGAVTAVWHCFTARKREINAALDWAAAKGVYLAIGGLVTFEAEKALRLSASRIPGELLLLETDAPYLLPRPRGENPRNEPPGVIRVAEELAILRGASPMEVAAQTTANAMRLFGRALRENTYVDL